MKRAEMAIDPFELLSKKDRKPFIQRNNHIGLIYLAGHFTAIGAGGYLIFSTLGTIFVLPTMLLHGIVLACLFAPMHECSHGTAFRTRWLNEAVYWLVSLVYISQPTWYRYRHAVHHTYTQIQGKDPSMVLPSPTTFRQYLAQLSGLRFWYTFPVVMVRHASGNISPKDAWYAPDADKPRIYREARIMLAVYAAVAAAAVVIGTWAPLIYWLIPRVLGEPVQRSIRVAEHKGCEEGPDVRTNTRSTRTNAVFRALCWNMPYHSEHHLCPAAPFHKLPALSRAVAHKLKPMGESYLAVDREVRKRFIVSEVEAKRIVSQRVVLAGDWQCHLD